MLGAPHPMEAHRADSRAMFSRGQSADAREGVTSFLEKRAGGVPGQGQRRPARHLPGPPRPGVRRGRIAVLSFDDDIALRPVGEGVYEGDIQGRWFSPRGPLGGYVMGIVLNAFALAVDDPARTARSATTHFLRPPSPAPPPFARRSSARGGH